MARRDKLRRESSLYLFNDVYTVSSSSPNMFTSTTSRDGGQSSAVTYSPFSSAINGAGVLYVQHLGDRKRRGNCVIFLDEAMEI